VGIAERKQGKPDFKDQLVVYEPVSQIPLSLATIGADE
jgi:hypothetical protein